MGRFTLGWGLITLLLLGCRGAPQHAGDWEKALLRHKSPPARRQLLEQLRNQGPLSPALLPVLQTLLAADRAPPVRAAIVQLLVQTPHPSSVQPLLELLARHELEAAGKDAGATHEAARLIAEGLPRFAPLGPEEPAVLAALVQLLGCPDVYTRVGALRALGALRAGVAVEPLLQLAADAEVEPFLSAEAIRALGAIGDARAAPALVRLMFEERRGVSLYRPSALALYGLGSASTDSLLAALTGQDPELLTWAREHDIREPALYAKTARVLGELGDARTAQALVSRLSFRDENPRHQALVRIQVAQALGRQRARVALRALLGGLERAEDSAEREAFADALVDLGEREALPTLFQAAARGAAKEKAALLRAISLLGDERDLAPLRELVGPGEGNPYEAPLRAGRQCDHDASCWAPQLSHSSPLVRERAAHELARANERAALPALLDAMSDESNTRVRGTLVHAALWLVDGEPHVRPPASDTLTTLERLLVQSDGDAESVPVNEALERLVCALRRSHPR